MTRRISFSNQERLLQGQWLRENLTNHTGYAGVDYRLPPRQIEQNLSPAIQDEAKPFFAANPPIQWHQHANHGLSSQVCCLNFLMPFVDRPDVLRRWVEHVTGETVIEILPIETRGGRACFLTFEWIGDTDYLNEAKNGAQRKRGANATAADAAVMFRDAAGLTQLLLIEWKYTERYGQPIPPGVDGAANATRRSRYRSSFSAPDGPIRADAGVSLDDFFYEPFYQMLRQQMLAFQAQKHDAAIDRARILHLSPAGNRPLHDVTSPNLRRFGTDAFEIFSSLLSEPTNFQSMSIENAFAPLANWPDADWFSWLQSRYASLCSSAGAFA